MASLTFYFDRCFGKRFPEALAHAGIPQKVEYQHSKSNNFSQSMPDDAWLEICGKNGWIVFSHDQKFHSITTEATAIKQHKVGLPGANESTWEKVRYFASAYPTIVGLAALQVPPYVYRVHRNGTVVAVELP